MHGTLGEGAGLAQRTIVGGGGRCTATMFWALRSFDASGQLRDPRRPGPPRRATARAAFVLALLVTSPGASAESTFAWRSALAPFATVAMSTANIANATSSSERLGRATTVAPRLSDTRPDGTRARRLFGVSWQRHVIFSLADGAQSVYAIDVDGDGDIDVMSASLDDDTIAWYENVDGNGGSWERHIISTLADGATSV